MKNFTDLENIAIAQARAWNPDMECRKLARRIHEKCDMPIGEHLMYRSFESIYSALRRYDASLVARGAAEAVLTGELS